MSDKNSMLKEMAEALRPFAIASFAIDQYDPTYPMDGSALRASFDCYANQAPFDTIEDMNKYRVVRRRDLVRAAELVALFDAAHLSPNSPFHTEKP